MSTVSTRRENATRRYSYRFSPSSIAVANAGLIDNKASVRPGEPDDCLELLMAYLHKPPWCRIHAADDSIRDKCLQVRPRRERVRVQEVNDERAGVWAEAPLLAQLAVREHTSLPTQTDELLLAPDVEMTPLHKT